MREDTSFSEKKLTREEFSKKYWMNGEKVYQYHTAEIEDGRDEREQFLINNCRAIKDLTVEFYERSREDNSTLYKELDKEIKTTKRVGFLLFVMIGMYILMNGRKQ